GHRAGTAVLSPRGGDAGNHRRSSDLGWRTALAEAVEAVPSQRLQTAVGAAFAAPTMLADASSAPVGVSPAAPTTTPEAPTLPNVEDITRLLPPYKVLLHNDDHNSMDHVVRSLLRSVPQLSRIRAGVSHAHLGLAVSIRDRDCRDSG